eukprot:scaffold322314_cov41-Prasinocladus_malaysianus.AAC.1
MQICMRLADLARRCRRVYSAARRSLPSTALRIRMACSRAGCTDVCEMRERAASGPEDWTCTRTAWMRGT